MKIIKNINDINGILSPYIEKAMKLTRDEIFQVISRKVEAYYDEPVFNGSNEPMTYERTYNLMESLSGGNVISTGNGFQFTVGWDDDYYTFSYEDVTGLQVLEFMDNRTHGGTVRGKHRFFQEALDELGHEAGILALFKKNCKAVGMPLI